MKLLIEDGTRDGWPFYRQATRQEQIAFVLRYYVRRPVVQRLIIPLQHRTHR